MGLVINPFHHYKVTINLDSAKVKLIRNFLSMTMRERLC